MKLEHIPIWEEICTDLTEYGILRKAEENNETPFGYVLGYIKDVYSIPKTDGWGIAEKVLEWFKIKS